MLKVVVFDIEPMIFNLRVDKSNTMIVEDEAISQVFWQVKVCGEGNSSKWCKKCNFHLSKKYIDFPEIKCKVIKIRLN